MDAVAQGARADAAAGIPAPGFLETGAIAEEGFIYGLPIVMNVDGNTFNCGYVGSRATGNDPGGYLVAGPRWEGEAPAGVRKVFRSSTDFSLAIFRTQQGLLQGRLAAARRRGQVRHLRQRSRRGDVPAGQECRRWLGARRLDAQVQADVRKGPVAAGQAARRCRMPACRRC
jgi:hypothetical protein